MVTIFSLNIRHGQGSASGELGKDEPWKLLFPKKKMKENAETIGSFIKQYSPDVVCLQEANWANLLWPDVAKVVAAAAGYRNLVRSPRSVFSHNNAILTNLEITGTANQQYRNWRNFGMLLSHPFHYFYGLNRGFIAVHIESVGWVFNTHLQPFHHPLVRLAEVKEMRGFMEGLHKDGQPIIVTGDFNTWTSDEPCLEYLANGCQSTLKLVATPPFTEQNFVQGATYPAGGISDASVSPKARLDYILTSPSVKTVSLNRILTGLTDHYGLLMECE